MVVIVHISCGERHDKYEELDFFEENDDILLLLLVASGITKEAATGECYNIYRKTCLCWSLCLIKVQSFRPASLLKEIQQRCFPVNFYKILRELLLKKIWE